MSMIIKNQKMVCLETKGSLFNHYIRFWLDCHPRTTWWSDKGEDEVYGWLTMSDSSWRKFCRDYNLDYKKL